MFAFFHFMFKHGAEHIGPRCNQYHITAVTTHSHDSAMHNCYDGHHLV